MPRFLYVPLFSPLPWILIIYNLGTQEFFRVLAICHTVLPEGEENPQDIEYLAASPDEAAMVTAAKIFGFFFYRSVSVQPQLSSFDLLMIYS